MHSGEVVVVGIPLSEGDLDKSHAVFNESSGKKTTLSEGMTTVSISKSRLLLGQIEGGEIFALHDAHRFIEESFEIFGIRRGILLMEALVHGIRETQPAFKILFTHGRVSTGSL